jgi:NitT/TauT family transport system substrate-binding protein
MNRRTLLKYAFGPNTQRNGWGAMDAAMWQEQIDLYAALGQFTKRVPKVDEVMTLAVLKATEDERPKIG